MHAATPPDLISSRIRSILLTALAIAALAILLLGNYTDIDMRLAAAMYDRHTHSFPWQHAWLTERFGHVILKQVLTALALIPILMVAGDSLLRKPHLAPWWRLRLRLLAACAIAIPGITSLLKQSSSSHCPWDLQRFGGSEQYYRLLDHIPAWVEAGKCLPGGHASSALWLIGLAVFWLPGRPVKALLVACAMLLLGIGLGWLQQMRGAHFLSHTLWSAWIACAILTALLSLVPSRAPMQGRRLPRSSPAA